MRKESKKQMKGNKGITLIALVVTIVVLLILSGITISTLFGDNGIITAARKAAEDTKQGENDVNKGLSDLEKNINEQVYGIVEPKNVEDWKWIEDEVTKTITITKYIGHDTEVVIPNSIGGKKVKAIGKQTEDISDGFGDYNIWDISICSNNTTYYGYPQETITKVTISDGIEIINISCFGNTKNLKEIIIPKSVKSIGKFSFANCSKLETINIPDNITNIGYCAFHMCTGLTSITIPGSVTTTGGYIFNCIPSLTVNVPFTEGNKPSGWDSNWNSTNDGTVTVNYMYETPTDPKYFTYTLNESTKTATISGVEEKYAAKGYYRGAESEWDIITAIKTESGEYITDIILPSKLTKDGKEYTVTEIGDYAFGNSDRINWKNSYTIEKNFTSFKIPQSITKIGNNAFYGCEGLTNVTIPGGVTSIGESAFFGCTGLTNITIPSSITTMGSYVFYNIPSITVTVPFTSGNKPSGWASSWNYTSSGCTISVNYQQ